MNDTFTEKTPRITAIGFSPALLSVLSEHLGSFHDDGTTPPDIVIAEKKHAAGATSAFTAVPVLEIEEGRNIRIGAVMRQVALIAEDPLFYTEAFDIAGKMFEPQEKILRDAAGDVVLTDREAGIVVYLAKNNARSVPRDELLEKVFGYQSGLDTHTLETHIYRLRQKLGAIGEQIVTDDQGYRIFLSLSR